MCSSAGRAGIDSSSSVWVYGFLDMVALMKTTIDLPDALFRRIKEVAQREGVPMREIIIDGALRELDRRETPTARPDFVFPSVNGNGLRQRQQGDR